MNETQVVEELNSVIADQAVDEVLVALPIDKYGSLVETIVRQCEVQGVIVRVQTGMTNLHVGKAYVDELQGVPVMTIQSGPQDSWQLVAKRVIDLLGSATLLFALAPFLIFVAILIRFDSPGPVFFTQERVGLNKRRFRILKFRTMTDGSDQQQGSLEHLNEAEGPVFKIRNDPRVTPLGRFLRRFSIDELPQLINVLKGDMSLVGSKTPANSGCQSHRSSVAQAPL